MRIIFLADLHFALKQYDWLLAHAGQYDLVVIGGDLLDLGSTLDIDTQISVIEKYLARLTKSSRLAVSSGNHDGDSRNAADESVAKWLLDARGLGYHADGEGFDFQDFRITICPWWDGDLARGEIQSQLEREAALVRGRWMWIYHAPPEGAATSWSGRKYIGDDVLRKWIDRFQPDMVLSGHIHNAPFMEPGAWIDRIGRTWVFNPGRQPGPQPASLTIDLEAMTALWNSAAETVVRDLRGVDAGKA